MAENQNKQVKCEKKCEVFSRVVGYHRPVQQWNLGKQEEFGQRKPFDEDKSINSKFATLGKPSASAEDLSSY